MSERSLHYPFADAPAPGETVEVAPGVRWLRMPMPFPPGHINLWLLEDDGRWAIVDSGLATGDTRALWARLLADYRPSRLICTHFHHDHAGLAGELTRRYALPFSISSPEWAELMRLDRQHSGDDAASRTFFLRHGLPEATLSAAIAAFSDEGFAGAPPDDYQSLAAGDTLHIGGASWQVLVGEGHSPGHVLLYCAQKGVLIAGDQLLPRITPSVGLNAGNAAGDPLAGWLASMRALQGLPADTLVLPSHQLPFVGAGVRAAQIAAYHQAQLTRLLSLVGDAPGCAHTLARALFTRLTGAVSELMAVSETLAHLRYLEARGQCLRKTGADGVERWQAHASA